MTTDTNGAILELPDGFDERDEAELALKGHLSNVVVRLADGSRYDLHFIDPDRLRQELALDAQAGTPYFAEPGLIVLPDVTLAVVRSTVQRLVAGHYFQYRRPLAPDAAANGVATAAPIR